MWSIGLIRRKTKVVDIGPRVAVEMGRTRRHNRRWTSSVISEWNEDPFQATEARWSGDIVKREVRAWRRTGNSSGAVLRALKAYIHRL